MSDDRQVGKLGKCSKCGLTKILFYQFRTDPDPNLKIFYCKECYDSSKEKVICPDCNKEYALEDMAKHKLDIHTAWKGVTLDKKDYSWWKITSAKLPHVVNVVRKIFQHTIQFKKLKNPVHVQIEEL